LRVVSEFTGKTATTSQSGGRKKRRAPLRSCPGSQEEERKIRGAVITEGEGNRLLSVWGRKRKAEKMKPTT